MSNAKSTKKSNTKAVATKVEKQPLTLPEIRTAILEYAKAQKAQINETGSYTGIRINSKNAMEVHISKKQVTLIFSEKALATNTTLHKACLAEKAITVVPPTFKWVLDCKYAVNNESQLPTIQQLIDVALTYTATINNTATKQAKAV